MANILSLEILIIPRGVEQNWGSDENYGDESQLAITLYPLERLRNIPRFKIRPAEFHEIPKFAFSSGESLAVEFTPILPDPVDEVRLVTLIEGDSEVERIDKMYNFLLKYKYEMGPNTFKLSEPSTHDWTASNPFESSRHPVETTLRAAKFAMMEDSMDVFKATRATIIRYLEPQYQNIKIASKNVAGFIKEQKIKGGLFEPNRYHLDCIDVATEAMVLLEDYEATFYRQLEPATKIAIRKQKQLLITRYEALPREKLIKQCEIAYEKQWWERFIDCFKEAINEMDTQYLAIREARKKLYASDLKSTFREVDVEPMLCDEMIDWNAYEIDMRINDLDGKYQQYTENETIVSVHDQVAEASPNGLDEPSEVDVQNNMNISGEDNDNEVSHVNKYTQDEDEQQESVSPGSESGSEEGDSQLIGDQNESDTADVSETGENDQDDEIGLETIEEDSD
ncbi:hypothetical protein EYC80_002369 [Monilinia laxa]|uniref:Uncharacterized protein n=1 Tax=Monilinia laxa TaxID=61186 RepID=A0A5N6K3S3_MONLA|nr:hypothetical protein EYC80_002369 [Monilinia laxa]